MMYLIYGKRLTDKRWEACDLANGTFTNRLLYASMFQYKIQAQEIADKLNELEPDLEFQVRRR